MNSDSDDVRNKCSYCAADCGKASLRKCSSCKLSRYCSRECQKKAWKTHKASCNTTANMLANLVNDPEGRSLNDTFSRWLNSWKPILYGYALDALDLANHPADRLATHNVVIEIEKRPSPPSSAQTFRMFKGCIMSDAEWVQAMRDTDCTDEVIEDWKRDRRGDDTVRIIVICEDLVRFLYFSLKDKGDSRRVDSEASKDKAQDWDSKLKMVIEVGMGGI